MEKKEVGGTFNEKREWEGGRELLLCGASERNGRGPLYNSDGIVWREGVRESALHAAPKAESFQENDPCFQKDR